MAKTDTSPKAAGEPADEPPSVSPLTRRGYKRTEAAQRQITNALGLPAADLIAQAQQKDDTAPGHLSAEALVYFIRRSDSAGDRKTRDALIRELLERCNVFFRGQFRGCSKEEREDLQSAVITEMIDDLLDPGDRGDFMQARFWLYLKRRTISACETAFRHSGDTESLDTGFSGEAESEGRTKLEAQVDERLNPEELAMLSEGLAALPPRLRQVYLLRHYVGMKIGADNPANDPPNEVTLARRFDCTGRTIRNWLKEAEALLARFREN